MSLWIVLMRAAAPVHKETGAAAATSRTSNVTIAAVRTYARDGPEVARARTGGHV